MSLLVTGQSVQAFAEQANLQSLQESPLNEHPKFQTLMRKLEEFYEDCRLSTHEQTFHKGKTVIWKKHLYSSLQTLLSEVTYTSDLLLQMKLLDKIESWYTQKVSTKSSSKTKPHISFPLTIIKKEVPETPSTRAAFSPEPYVPKLTPKFSNFAKKKQKFKKLDDEYEKIRMRENEELKLANNKARILMSWGKQRSRELEERNEKLEINRLKMWTPEDFSKTYSPELVKSSYSNYKISRKSPNIFDLRTFESRKSMENSSHILRIRERHQKLIELPDEVEVKEDQKISSSMELRTRNSRQMVRKNEFAEVLFSKRKLASRGIICMSKALERGLVEPEESFSPIKLPLGGEKLMSKTLLDKISHK